MHVDDTDGQEGDQMGDVLFEKGKARAGDGELVGPDLRRENSVEENSMFTPLSMCGGRGVANDLLDPANLLLRFQRFDKSQRMEFLSDLLGDLQLNEAVTITRRIEPRLRRDFLKELPLELALHAMSFVSYPL